MVNESCGGDSSEVDANRAINYGEIAMQNGRVIFVRRLEEAAGWRSKVSVEDGENLEDDQW